MTHSLYISLTLTWKGRPETPPKHETSTPLTPTTPQNILKPHLAHPNPYPNPNPHSLTLTLTLTR